MAERVNVVNNGICLKEGMEIIKVIAMGVGNMKIKKKPNLQLEKKQKKKLYLHDELSNKITAQKKTLKI